MQDIFKSIALNQPITMESIQENRVEILNHFSDYYQIVLVHKEPISGVTLHIIAHELMCKEIAYIYESWERPVPLSLGI